ncbi:hypothetical protein AIW19_06855, partial [Salmonella enterica]|nr:hypothetical protein [Salmonella enterica]
MFFSLKKQSTTRNDSLLFLRLVLNTFLFALLPKQGIVMNFKKNALPLVLFASFSLAGCQSN